MRYSYVFILVLLSMSACKKDEDDTQTIGDVIAQASGNKTGMRINFTDFGSSVTYVDTVPFYPFTIQKLGDSSLSIEQQVLFYTPAQGDGYNFGHPSLTINPIVSLYISPGIDSIRYRYRTGGMGGGEGYIIQWKKP